MNFRGRPATAPIKISEIRPLTREDLAEVIDAKRLGVGAVQRLRDPHHNLARLIAAGVRPNEEISRRSGYTTARIIQLNKDPAFVELVASYRDKIDAAFVHSQDEYFELATKNMVMAERMIAEKLEIAEEEGTLPPVRDLLAISRDAADRFGYGKKTTNLNVNVDFASKLEAAIARSRDVSIDSPSLSPEKPRAMLEVAMSRQPHASRPMVSPDAAAGPSPVLVSRRL